MTLVSRTDTFAKLFFIITFAGLFMYMFLAFYTFQSAVFSKHQTKAVQNKIQSLPDLDVVAPLKNIGRQTMKYILLWRIDNKDNPIEEGQEPFKKYNCLHQNCYFTTDTNLLNDYTEFHAIVFDGQDLKRWNKTELPTRRSWDQKYVFFSKNSSEDFPICNSQADEYFNWTWSYKLYSDIFSPFFEVRDLKGGVVAPSQIVVWTRYIDGPIDMMSVDKTTKSKAMASVWKNCRSSKGLQMKNVIKSIIPSLKSENLKFDIFGCSNHSCEDNCLKEIERDYFFYWVNDGSFSEDYVTDTFLTAIETNTVPIFSGLADYSKFLPPGSYISGKHMAAEDLAAIINYAIQNTPVYLSYFRWKKYYTIHRTPYFHGLCQLCSHLNNHVLMERHTHYRMFRRWWYPGPMANRCMKREPDNEPIVPLLWKNRYHNVDKASNLSKEKEKLF